MLPIRKHDMVILPDSGIGKVLDIIPTELVTVYKVEKLVDNQIMYVEETLVRLGKQCTASYVLTLSYEIWNFLCYTLTP